MTLYARLGESYAAMPPSREKWLTSGSITLVATILLLVLLIPGATYAGNYVHDIMIFYDVADRILDGQVPNRDFHSALGPLAFLLPAVGLWLSGSLGGMFPAATTIFTLLMLPLLLYVCLSRLRLLYGVGFGIFISFLVIVPLNPGGSFDTTSYAMFYNRFGWALLSMLVLLALPRRAEVGSRALDAIVVAVLLALMFYLKISYAAVALVFSIGLIFLSPLGTAAAGGLLLAAAIVLGVDLLWGGTSGYIADLRNAGAASGLLGEGGLAQLTFELLENVTGSFVFLLLLVIAFLRGVGWRTLLLLLAIGGAGLLIINQNAEATGVLTFVPAGMLAVLAPAARESKPEDSWPLIAGSLLIATLAVPFVTTAAASLLYQFVMGIKGGRGGPYEVSIDGLRAREGHLESSDPALHTLRSAYRSGFANVALLNVARHARLRQPLGQAEYLHTVVDGVRLLKSDPSFRGSIFVLDFANPMNAFLGRSAPLNTDAWNHFNRTFTAKVHRPAEAVFRDVELVMEPKAPSELTTSQNLRSVYGAYVERHFRLAAESDYWRLWQRAAR